jgi:hypothetical protein
MLMMLPEQDVATIQITLDAVSGGVHWSETLPPVASVLRAGANGCG